MSGNRAVLDSNILVYLSKGQIAFDEIESHYTSLYASAVTYMEVLGFNFKNIIEETKLKLLLNSISIAHTNMEIATHVIDFRKKKKIKIPDAIILATAKHLNADVLTENRKDFKGLGWDDKIVSPSGLQ